MKNFLTKKKLFLFAFCALLATGILSGGAYLQAKKTPEMLDLKNPQKVKEYANNKHSEIDKIAKESPNKTIKTLISFHEPLTANKIEEMLEKNNIKKLSMLYLSEGESSGGLSVKKGESIPDALKKLDKKYNEFLDIVIEIEKNPEMNEKFRKMKNNAEEKGTQIYAIEVSTEAKNIKKLKDTEPKLHIAEKIGLFEKKLPINPNYLTK